MRKLITIIFLIVSFISSGQIQGDGYDEYYRKIDWKFFPDSIVAIDDTTYLFKAEPYDFNDPGSSDRLIGNYVVDFVGHWYKIIDSTDVTLTVIDEYHTGVAPQSGQVAHCYLSVNNGEGFYVGSVDHSTLDFSSRWKTEGKNNEIQWDHGIEYYLPFKRLVLDTAYTILGDEPPATEYWDIDNISIRVADGIISQPLRISDTNGKATESGQFPVYDADSTFFRFNHRINNDPYSSDWDGRDTMIPTFDNLYDKLSQFESVNYCTDSAIVNFGTITTGSQADLCVVDGNDLVIAEVAPNPPFQVDFLFQGVERLQYFSFYGDYDGGQSHQVHVLAYNVNTLTWDFIGEFGASTIKRWYSFPIYVPNNYINGLDEVKIRVEHQGTGIISHRMYFDYVEVNFGGTGGGNFITAGSVDFNPYLNITSTNVQGAIQQFYDLWDLTDHPEATMTGTPDYMTINPSTQVITRNQIDLTTDVTGLLPDGNISSATTWNNHVASTSNPHNVTVDQLGIGADTITYTSHGLSAGDWFGYKNNAIIKCLADTSVNANLKGVVKEVIDVNNFTYLKTGDLYTDGVFVAGENYVLSTTTPGTIEQLDAITYTLGDVYVFVGEGTDKGLDINIDVGFVIDTLETPEITVYKYEKQLTTSENVVDIGYTVNSSTLVFLNGYITSDWTGSGTSVTLNGDILANDYMIAIASGTTSLYSDVLAEDETVVVLPFTMESTSLPFYNGTVLQSSQYSGSITFSLDVKENDNTIIKQ